MFVIIRHNETTGHRYVHSDGQNDMTFKSADEAEREVARIKKFGTHAARSIGIFRSTREARTYCRLLGQGLAEYDAIEQAIS